MASKAEEAERERVEAAVRAVVKEGGFLCPECGTRCADFVVNQTYGFVCATCDAAIRLSE